MNFKDRSKQHDKILSNDSHIRQVKMQKISQITSVDSSQFEEKKNSKFPNSRLICESYIASKIMI